jgi:hypothetical protein
MAKRFSLAIFLMALLAVACGSQPTATPIPPPTPTFAPPLINHELNVRIDPREAGQVLLNPLPLEQSRYLSGRTVTIDILPNKGWRVTDWAGPVHEIAGEPAKITMVSSQTVVVRMVREGGTAGGPGIVPSSGRPVFIRSIEAIGEAVGSEDSNAVFLVSIVDNTGAPVAGAEFTGQIVTPSGSRTTGGTTGADGVGKVVVPVAAGGQFKFEVTDITGTGLSYQPALNNVVQAVMQSNSAAFTITASSGKSGTIATFKVTTNRPLGDWIVKKKGGGTTKKGNFKGKALTSSFTRTMTGCKPDVKEYTATIRTLMGLVTKDASFTITAPPCKEDQKVHVDGLNGYSEIKVDDRNTEIIFLVGVADQNNSLLDGELVTVTGVIEGPGGFSKSVDAQTDANGVAAFRELVSKSGAYSLTILGLSGDGIQYDPRPGEFFFYEVQVVIGTEYYLVDDDTHRITAEIRLGWSYVAAEEDDEDLPYLSAALSIFEWQDNLKNNDTADVTGFAAVIIDGSGDDGPISMADLEEIVADESTLPDNCRELAATSPVDEYLGFGIVNTYFCDDGGTFDFRLYSQPDSVSILMVVARLLTEQDGEDFSVFEQTLDWVPSFIAEKQRTVYLSQASEAGYDDQTGEVWLSVAIVDGGETVYLEEFSGLIQGPDSPDAFPFESLSGILTFKAHTGGLYEFTVTSLEVEDATYDPSLNEAGPTFRVMVNPGYDPAVDPTVHLFDGGSFVDEDTGDLVFGWVVQDSNGDIVLEPVVTDYFVEPDGMTFGFRSSPVEDGIGTTFTIDADATMPGTYTFTVTHISVDGAGYNPDDNERPIVIEGSDDRGGTVSVIEPTLVFDTIENALLLTVPVVFADGNVPSNPVVYIKWVDPSGFEQEFEMTPFEPFGPPKPWVGNPSVGVNAFTILDVYVPGAYYDSGKNEGSIVLSFDRKTG